MTRRPVVAVIGGGITGLAAAHHIAAAGLARVVVYEASDRVGGVIADMEVSTATIDAGADAFIGAAGPAADLARAAGLGDDLVSPAVFGGLIFGRGSLRPLPEPSLWGVPGSLGALRRSGLVSRRGWWRASYDYLLPPIDRPERSLGNALRRRLGDETFERVVEPMLSGIRSGAADHLDLDAAAPPLASLLRTGRSVMRGIRAAPPGSAEFRGIRGGMARLPGEIATGLSDVRRRTRVRSIEPRPGGGYDLVTSAGRRRAAGVVVAVPAWAAAPLLESSAPDAAVALAAIPYGSSVVVALAYRRGTVVLPEGTSGFLVPHVLARDVSGATFYSRKWPERAGTGDDIVRAVVGRDAADAALHAPDDEVIRRVTRDLELTAGLRRPGAAVVQRWERALPQLTIGHRERVSAIHAALAQVRGVAAAGGWTSGPGINDCVASARVAADKVVAEVTAAQG